MKIIERSSSTIDVNLSLRKVTLPDLQLLRIQLDGAPDNTITFKSHHHLFFFFFKKYEKEAQKIKAYGKSLENEPTGNWCLLILDLKPFRL